HHSAAPPAVNAPSQAPAPGSRNPLFPFARGARGIILRSRDSGPPPRGPEPLPSRRQPFLWRCPMVYRVLALVVVGWFALATVGLDAGDKKGKDKGAKDGTKATGKLEPGSIEIYKTKGGEYRYRIKNAEGKTIAMPLPQMHWEKKEEVMHALDELRLTLNK